MPVSAAQDTLLQHLFPQLPTLVIFHKLNQQLVDPLPLSTPLMGTALSKLRPHLPSCRASNAPEQQGSATAIVSLASPLQSLPTLAVTLSALPPSSQHLHPTRINRNTQLRRYLLCLVYPPMQLLATKPVTFRLVATMHRLTSFHPKRSHTWAVGKAARALLRSKTERSTISQSRPRCLSLAILAAGRASCRPTIS